MARLGSFFAGALAGTLAAGILFGVATAVADDWNGLCCCPCRCGCEEKCPSVLPYFKDRKPLDDWQPGPQE